MNRGGCWILMLAALGWWAEPAGAHDFPTPFQLLTQRDRPDRLVVALRPGLAMTENGGAQWNFLCGAVFGVAGNDPYAVTLTAGGNLLVGAFTGLYRDDGMGCGWSKVLAVGLPSGRVVSLSLLDDGAVLALTAIPAMDNGLYVSRDDGISWSPHGAPLGAAMPNSLARAPSDPERIYVTGTKLGGSAVLLWTTRDGGQTWHEIVLAGEQRAELLAVDPSDPERVYVRRVSFDPLLRDAITVSEDGGVTHRLYFELADVGGLALADDGETVWVGSRAGGLYRAARGETPQPIDSELRVGCLQQRDGMLWVCARDQSGFDPFAVAISGDRGERLKPMLRSDQLRRLRTCGSPVQASTCSSEWTQWKYDVFGSGEEPPLLPPDAGMRMDGDASGVAADAAVGLSGDAGIEPTAGGSQVGGGGARADVGSGSCVVARGGGQGWPVMWMVGVVGLGWRVRRRVARRVVGWR